MHRHLATLTIVLNILFVCVHKQQQKRAHLYRVLYVKIEQEHIYIYISITHHLHNIINSYIYCTQFDVVEMQSKWDRTNEWKKTFDV